MSGKIGEVTLATKLYYGFGSVAYGVKNNGFSYFLVFFYERVMGLEAILLASPCLSSCALTRSPIRS